jgi:hypothetical protein
MGLKSLQYLHLKVSVDSSHHAKGLVNPKVLAKNQNITDFRYPTAEHVDSENIKWDVQHWGFGSLF